MTWIRLEGTFAEHPKIIGLSNAAFRLHINALCYCGRHLTDGKISQTAVKSLANGNVVKGLIDAGLWSKNGDGYVIHDYLEYQQSRAAAKARIEAGRVGGLASGKARRLIP